MKAAQLLILYRYMTKSHILVCKGTIFFFIFNNEFHIFHEYLCVLCRYVEHFNTKDWTFEDQQIRDDTLRAYCRDHGVNLLEIKYDEIGRIPKILAKAIKKCGKR